MEAKALLATYGKDRDRGEPVCAARRPLRPAARMAAARRRRPPAGRRPSRRPLAPRRPAAPGGSGHRFPQPVQDPSRPGDHRGGRRRGGGHSRRRLGAGRRLGRHGREGGPAAHPGGPVPRAHHQRRHRRR
ncbi:hypothetical protein [Streptomyces sp. NPDC047130]|uniref:hypothetical protein n=1 Tax=Streptomyces sp. NPDC047130 TaxID=3155261 RepID=UPI0033D88FDF